MQECQVLLKFEDVNLSNLKFSLLLLFMHTAQSKYKQIHANQGCLSD